jgi:hypothetical protein
MTIDPHSFRCVQKSLYESFLMMEVKFFKKFFSKQLFHVKNPHFIRIGKYFIEIPIQLLPIIDYYS